MDPVGVKLGSFVNWVVTIYIALIGVVSAFKQGDHVMAAVGLAATFLVFLVAPVVAWLVMAIREARGGRSPNSSKS